MLILSRKRGESIMIGDEVEVRVLDIGGDKVRLGVVGPACIAVHLRERYEAGRQVERTGRSLEVEGILAGSSGA
jgi:carbon storage regulator